MAAPTAPYRHSAGAGRGVDGSCSCRGPPAPERRQEPPHRPGAGNQSGSVRCGVRMSKRRRLTKRQLKAIRGDESLREASRPPITLAGQNARPTLQGEKRAYVVQKVVASLRDWRANRWEGEASARYGIRVGLILQGNGWHDSDAAAADVVRRAFNLLGRGKETRPSKEEGQRYFVDRPRQAPVRFGVRLPVLSRAGSAGGQPDSEATIEPPDSLAVLSASVRPLPKGGGLFVVSR